MIYFDNCDMVINSSGILAESASINAENTLSPIYAVGKRGILNQSPAGNNPLSFRFNYIAEISHEPNFSTVDLIKNLIDDSSYEGVTLEIGGITGFNCYLESYTLKSVPNDLVKASATYLTFSPLAGNLRNKRNYTQYNANNALAHGWMTFVLSRTDAIQVPTYEFNYEFNAKWEPVYIIGQPEPSQVKLQDASERTMLVRDVFYNIQFSGEDACNSLINCQYDDQNIEIFNLAFLCTGNYTGDLYYNAPFQASDFNFITNMECVPTSDGAIISWDTSSPSTSQIYYGPITGSALTTTKDFSLLTGHSVQFTGLTNNMQYYFQIYSETYSHVFRSSVYRFNTVPPIDNSEIYAGSIEEYQDKFVGDNAACNILKINVSGAKIKSTTVQASLDDIVRTSTVITKYY